MTHNRRRVEHYAADLETLDRLQTVLSDALARMGDSRLGFPASSLGGSSGDQSSPVERIAIAGDHPANDPGRAAIAAYDRLSHELHHVAEAMHHLVGRWAPHQPDPRARASTEAANIAECAHHRATIGVHEDMRVHSDAAGNLEHPMALCDYCWRFVRKVGRLPSRTELERVRNGQRVRVSAR